MFDWINKYNLQGVKEGMPKVEVQNLIDTLLDRLYDDELDYDLSIEYICDLVYLKENNNLKLDKSISRKLLSYIILFYDYNKFILKQKYTGNDQVESDKVEAFLSNTISVLMKIDRSDRLKKFTYRVLANSSSNLEESYFESLLDSYFEGSPDPDTGYVTPLELVNEVITRVNKYHAENVHSRNTEEVLVSIGDTIKEYENSCSIYTCYKSDLYKSPSKRTRFLGLGKTFCSKNSDTVKLVATYPNDWVRWFDEFDKK